MANLFSRVALKNGDRGGEMQGIAFAAVREEGARTSVDAYAAVFPGLRRRGLGSALFLPALHWVAKTAGTLCSAQARVASQRTHLTLPSRLWR